MKDRVIGVLPSLLNQASIPMCRVLNKAIAVRIAILIDPLKRSLDVGPNLFNQMLITGAPIIFTCKHDEERGGIHRTVVAGERNLLQIRHLSVPQFMKDLSRFRFARYYGTVDA